MWIIILIKIIGYYIVNFLFTVPVEKCYEVEITFIINSEETGIFFLFFSWTFIFPTFFLLFPQLFCQFAKIMLLLVGGSLKQPQKHSRLPYQFHSFSCSFNHPYKFLVVLIINISCLAEAQKLLFLFLNVSYSLDSFLLSQVKWNKNWS